MDKTEQRYERFAQLRAAYPDEDFDNIMTRIHDEEVDADEAAAGCHVAGTQVTCETISAQR